MPKIVGYYDMPTSGVGSDIPVSYGASELEAFGQAMTGWPTKFPPGTNLSPTIKAAMKMPFYTTPPCGSPDTVCWSEEREKRLDAEGRASGYNYTPKYREGRRAEEQGRPRALSKRAKSFIVLGAASAAIVGATYFALFKKKG